MGEYQKIQTLFKRDANNIIIPSQYTLEEFKYLENNVFEATEKIDGTNCRVEITPILKEDGSLEKATVEFKGRTDKAQMPVHLLAKLISLFDSNKLIEYFYKEKDDFSPIVLYGEGYGMKIQNGGNYIKNGVNFILFDIKVGNWWLSRETCEKIAQDLSVDIVPLMGYMTIPQAIEFVKKGFKSTIAENKDYDAEGLVLKTPNGLRLRNGERIITKIKTCDFKKFIAKYGENYTGEQPVNEKYLDKSK